MAIRIYKIYFKVDCFFFSNFITKDRCLDIWYIYYNYQNYLPDLIQTYHYMHTPIQTSHLGTPGEGPILLLTESNALPISANAVVQKFLHWNPRVVFNSVVTE